MAVDLDSITNSTLRVREETSGSTENTSVALASKEEIIGGVRATFDVQINVAGDFILLVPVGGYTVDGKMNQSTNLGTIRAAP